MKEKTVYVCDICGYDNPRWFGQCPQCRNWNTAQEVRQTKRPRASTEIEGTDATFEALIKKQKEPVTRITTRFNAFNRVLGGGIVPGSVLLIGGDPGVGKSTLLTQLADQKVTVFYWSGEESTEQIMLRAQRTNDATLDRLYVYNTNRLELALEKLQKALSDSESKLPDSFQPVLVVDSIQTMKSDEVSALPGGVVQIRECTAALVAFAKARKVPVIIVAHITKYGQIAGPKLIEHLVDVVLYFDGDSDRDLRILRSIKNRFGPTNEIGVFEMGENGLKEISDPSERFYDANANDSGNAISVILEGSTPFVVEVQALAVSTHFSSPRRLSKGVDQERLNLIAAVLSKRLNLPIENHDLYLNLLGGLKCSDPGIEFPIAVAIFSSFFDKTVPLKIAFFGEVGLDGKICGVSFSEKRITELARLGFSRIYLPKNKAHAGVFKKHPQVDFFECAYLKEALIEIFDGRS